MSVPANATATANTAALNKAANAAKSACGLTEDVKKMLSESSNALATAAESWADACQGANSGKTKDVANKLKSSAEKFAAAIEKSGASTAATDNAAASKPNNAKGANKNRDVTPPAAKSASTNPFNSTFDKDKAQRNKNAKAAAASATSAAATPANATPVAAAAKAAPPAPASTQNFLNLLNADKTSVGNPNVRNGYKNFGTRTNGGRRRSRKTRNSRNRKTKKRNTRRGSRKSRGNRR